MEVFYCYHIQGGQPPYSRWLNNDVIQELCTACDARTVEGIKIKHLRDFWTEDRLQSHLLGIRMVYPS